MGETLGIPPYRARRTWSQGVVQSGSWWLKTYGIAAPGRALPGAVFQAAMAYVNGRLPTPDPQDPNHGFVTLHAGEEAVWLLVDLWAKDILLHFLHKAPCNNPTDFAPAPANGIHACVWEMEVSKHERDAWVYHVLSHPGQPRLEAYRNDCLRIDAEP